MLRLLMCDSKMSSRLNGKVLLLVHVVHGAGSSRVGMSGDGVGKVGGGVGVVMT